MTVAKTATQEPLWSSLDSFSSHTPERRFSEDPNSKNRFSKILSKFSKWRRHSHDEECLPNTSSIHPEIQDVVEREASRCGKSARVLTYYPVTESAKPAATDSKTTGFESAIDPAVLNFFSAGTLLYGHQLLAGFYACLGDFSEVTKYGEPPSLKSLRDCPVKPGREVVFVGTMPDAFIVRLCHKRGSDPVLTVVKQVVRHVALLLGGAASDAQLRSEHIRHSMQIQKKQGNPVVPLSQLLVGTSFHRALLVKYVLGQFKIQTRIVSGATMYEKQLYIRDCKGTELCINLTDNPGQEVVLSSASSIPPTLRSVSSAVITNSPERTRIRVVNPVFQQDQSPRNEAAESESDAQSVQSSSRTVASDTWPFGRGGPQLHQAFPKQTLSSC